MRRGDFFWWRIVQRAFVVCLLGRARAARAWHVCVLVDVGREVFVSCAFGEMCDVRIFLGERIVQRAFIVVYWGVRARHVRGTCASWWMWGGKFLFRARLEKCVM